MKSTVLAAAFAATVLSGLVAAPALAENRHVKVVNATSQTMQEFYASNTGTNDWQEDIMGQDALPAGESVNINIDDGSGACKFDFKGVFDDGEAVVKQNVDVCEVATFTFTE